MSYVKYSVWYEPDDDEYVVYKSMGGAFLETISVHKNETDALANYDRIIANPPRLIREKAIDITKKE